MSICDAINSRRILEFDYDGHRRVIHPAAAGPHATTGNPVLRGYQVDGTSSSGVVPDWRLFEIDKIQNLVVLGETFDTDPPGYQKGDKHIAVECEL